MSYLSGESKRQITWKLLTKSLPKKAKEPGLYGSRLHAVCLPIDWAHHNLYPGIRSDIIETFSRERIVFHGSALPGMPSNHLCSSQVMAINIFTIFEQQPEVLKAYLLPFIPDIAGFVSFPSGRFVEFEWIGAVNYLGEKGHIRGTRMRGAGNTSIDVALRYQATDGRNVLVLLEQKWTESYGSTFLRFRSDGTDRAETYAPFFYADHSPMNLDRCHSLDAFLYEPHYQMLRQQLLAQEVLVHKEEPYDAVRVVQVYARANRALRYVTSPRLRLYGEDTYDVWRTLIRDQDSFITIAIEDLLKNPVERQFPDLIPWRQYLRERYRGIAD